MVHPFIFIVITNTKDTHNGGSNTKPNKTKTPLRVYVLVLCEREIGLEYNTLAGCL